MPRALALRNCDRSAACEQEHSDQIPPRRDQRRGESRHPLVGAQAGLQRWLRRREGGRVADHQVEARALAGQSFERVEGVALAGWRSGPRSPTPAPPPWAARASAAAELSIASALSAPAGKRGKGESADMGKDIQNARPPGQPLRERLVVALVEEQAGLLPAHHVGQ